MYKTAQIMFASRGQTAMDNITNQLSGTFVWFKPTTSPPHTELKGHCFVLVSG